MKWLLFITSVFRPLFVNSQGPLANPIDELKKLITKNITKAVIVFSAVTSLSIIFAAGVTIIALDIGAQLDQTGTLFLSSIIISGSVLCTVSLVIIALVTNSVKIRPQVLTAVEINPNRPIQDAVALLILDFVKEREEQRLIRNNYFTQHNDRGNPVPYSFEDPLH